MTETITEPIELKVGDIFHEQYEDEVVSLTETSNKMFINFGHHARIDLLVSDLETRYQKRESHLGRFSSAIGRVARKVAVPALAGGLVGLVTGAVGDNPESAQHLAVTGAAYGAAVSGTFELMKASISSKFKTEYREFIDPVKKGWEELKKDAPPDNSIEQAIVKTVDSFGEAIAMRFSDHETRARAKVLETINNYNPSKDYTKSDRIVSFGGLFSAVYGGIKYGAVGLAFNIISPFNVDLGLISSVGAASEVGDRKVSSLHRIQDSKLLREVHPDIEGLDSEGRGQLIGSLVSRWYGPPTAQPAIDVSVTPEYS